MLTRGMEVKIYASLTFHYMDITHHLHGPLSLFPINPGHAARNSHLTEITVT
jgi:hypothetical protein